MAKMHGVQSRDRASMTIAEHANAGQKSARSHLAQHIRRHYRTLQLRRQLERYCRWRDGTPDRHSPTHATSIIGRPPEASVRMPRILPTFVRSALTLACMAAEPSQPAHAMRRIPRSAVHVRGDGPASKMHQASRMQRIDDASSTPQSSVIRLTASIRLAD